MNYKFKFICGDDDFLVNEKAKLWYDKYTKEIKEDLSKEIIDGRANKIEDVRNIIIGFGESVQTKSLFLEKKVIWLKGINFISNTIIGNSKLTLDLLENLKALFNNLNNEVTILVSASPVHKAKNFYKCV